MKAKWFSTLLVVVMLLVTFVPLAGAAPTAASERSSFEIVSLQPDVAQALRSQGKKISYPFPNTANKGTKFNPVGDIVPALNTASNQNVLVIFANFTTTPPGGPATRLDLGTYFDPMLFGTVYDPPEYAPYPNHPTNRTLKNYY